MTAAARLPGAVCACGALVFGPAPLVHDFLRTHPGGPAHAVCVLTPGREPYEQVALVLDRARALAWEDQP